MCDECTRSNAPNVCHKLCPFGDRTSKFVYCPQSIGSTKIRSRYGHFRTICDQTVDNSPTDPFSLSFQWWSSKHGVATSIHFEDQLCDCTHRGPRVVDHDVWFAVQDGWDCFLHQFFRRVRCTVLCICALLQ